MASAILYLAALTSPEPSTIKEKKRSAHGISLTSAGFVSVKGIVRKNGVTAGGEELQASKTAEAKYKTHSAGERPSQQKPRADGMTSSSGARGNTAERQFGNSRRFTATPRTFPTTTTIMILGHVRDPVPDHQDKTRDTQRHYFVYFERRPPDNRAVHKQKTRAATPMKPLVAEGFLR